MKCFELLHYHNISTLFFILILFVCFGNAYFMDDLEEEGDDRVFGALPNLDISEYLSLIMEPHNAMVQVRRMLKASPLIPRYYTYRTFEIVPIEGRIICLKKVKNDVGPICVLTQKVLNMM